MPVQEAATVDHQTVERLSRRFAEVFEQLDAGDDVFAAEVFFDLNMPVWRFQLEGGGDIFATQLAAISQGPSRVAVRRTVPTVSGFVTEHEEYQQSPEGEVMARRLWLCEVRDGRITEVVGFCSGEWNDELKARHAAEAPMIRW